MRDHDSIRKKLSRRKYAKLVAGSGMAAMAGCPGDGGSDTDTPTEEPEDTDVDTDTGEDTETEESTPDPANRQRDTARIMITNTPTDFNWNPHTPADNTTGDLYMSEMYGFYNNEDASARLYGDDAVFDAPWADGVDEIDIVTWITDFEVEPPYDMYNSHDERSSFWNGDPMDAVARYNYERVTYFVDGNKYAEGQTHRAEAEGQWDFHWWYSDGSLDGADDDPQNRVILRDEAAMTGGDPILPREWSEPHVDQFEATASEDAYTSYIEEVQGDEIDLERLANKGWGSGPYELRSTDDIASDHATLRLRDDSDEVESPHPHREHITVPKLQLQFGNQDREQTLASQGAIDVHEGSMTPNNQWSPDSLPEHISELTSYLRTSGGDAWWFNMNNPHLENLWVRRALVTAIDWHQVGANGWGPQRSIPLDHDTGTLDAWSQAIFSDEFLDTIHSYPKEADVETADQYMERAGYTRDGGTWVDPDGNTFQLDVLLNSSIGDWVGACQTIQGNLAEWGVDSTLTSEPSSTWNTRLDTFANENAPNYDTTNHWYNPNNQFFTYKSQAAAWDNGSLLDGDPEVPVEGGEDRRSVDPGDEWTISGEPVQVHLPEDPSVMEAPDQAGAMPSLEGVTEYREVDMAQTFEDLRKPQEDEEMLQELFRTCAQYYNYYLPHFTYHQYTYGEWGNVRDFNWPDADSEALDWEHDFNITDTLTLGGIMQASYDDSLAREDRT